MARIELDHVTKIYPGAPPAVNDLTLDIPDSSFMVLVGPSGSGKSTALRMVAGLEDVTEGDIRIGGRVVNDLQPRERDIAMVFQSYALYPHLTVQENLAFGLQLHKVPKPEQQRRVAEAARILALEPFLERKPAALSGGQRQRVAMGRAIVRDPQAFLMDEPLSNLDAKLRVSTRAQLAALHDRLGVTTIYVTHDQIEAMTLGTKVAVLKDGQLMQVDAPQNLFDAPANLFVATFIGSPAMNLAEGRLVRDDGGGVAVVFADHRVHVPEGAIAEHPGLERFLDRQVILGIRPSSFEDAAFAPPRRPRFKAEARVTERLGSEVDVIFAVRTPPVEHEVMVAQFDQAAKQPAGQDQDQTGGLVGEGESLWTARVNPHTSVRPGRAIDLAVDTSELYWFDPDSGQAIPRQAAGDRPGSDQDPTPPEAVA
jgi:multiple sugar transport system ATP-binding protein